MTRKQNLNLMLFAFLLSITIGCKETVKEKSTDESIDEKVKIAYIEMDKIPDASYTNNAKDSKSISWSKLAKNTSTIISVRTFEEQNFGDTDAFVAFAENYMENQMKPYEMKSLHFDVEGFKNTTCLKFDGTFRDSTNQGTNKEFISHIGYLCLPPDNGSEIAEIKVVHYSTENLMPNEVIYEFQNMLEKLKFTKN